MNKLLIIGVVLAVALSGVALLKGGTVVEKGTEVLGQGSNFEFPSYTSSGGMRTVSVRSDSLNRASTTICAIQGPAATSTVRFVSLDLAVSTTTATLLTIATSTTAFSTSTAILVDDVVATSTKYHYASGDLAGGLVQEALAPNSWVVFSLRQRYEHSGTYSPTGVCQASFITTSY